MDVVEAARVLVPHPIATLRHVSPAKSCSSRMSWWSNISWSSIYHALSNAIDSTAAAVSKLVQAS